MTAQQAANPIQQHLLWAEAAQGQLGGRKRVGPGGLWRQTIPCTRTTSFVCGRYMQKQYHFLALSSQPNIITTMPYPNRCSVSLHLPSAHPIPSSRPSPSFLLLSTLTLPSKSYTCYPSIPEFLLRFHFVLSLTIIVFYTRIPTELEVVPTTAKS